MWLVVRKVGRTHFSEIGSRVVPQNMYVNVVLWWLVLLEALCKNMGLNNSNKFFYKEVGLYFLVHSVRLKFFLLLW